MKLPRKLTAYLDENQFTLARHTKHYVYKHKSGRIVVISSTVSDGFGLRNALGDINRILKDNGQPIRCASQLGV